VALLLEVPLAYKILLADDSVTVQKIITLTFSDEGVDVETVNDGDEAINKLQYMRPALVMADVSIPGKDGYEICEYVKSHPELSHIPVVLLVPAFEPFDAERAREIGADHHLTKPFQSIRTLISTIKDLIESPGKIQHEADTAEYDVIEEVVPAEDVSADVANVFDMTSRLAGSQSARGETKDESPKDSAADDEADQTDIVAESEPSEPAGIAVEAMDEVLDLDDLLAEAWAPPVPADQPLKPSDEEKKAAHDDETTIVISQQMIDEIVERVVSQVTANLVGKLSDEIARRLALEFKDQAAERQVASEEISFRDQDTLLEIDEL